ncbi:MAG: hypothetical protein WAT79_01030 [Saprospiraceae bacterium]
MYTSEIFGKLAITTLIIAAGVALYIVAFNNWEKIILEQNIGVFYFFGFFFILFIIIALIAFLWER